MPIFQRPFGFGAHWIPFAEMEAFARRLRDTRQACGMTQWDFAEKLDVSSNTVWSWEKGRSRPNPSRIKKIASVLEVTEEFLRTGADVVEATPEDDSHEPLTSDIEQLRQKIALAVGILPSQVRLSVEFLSD
jgi:transcriptional regulator with XRE-family HTH domain